jgi:hypothetical protein
MDPQLEEIVRQIADAVDRRLATRFDDAEERLTKQFAGAEERLSKQFADAEARLAQQFTDAEGRLVKQFSDAEGRSAKQFADAENRLSEGAKAHMEELRTLVQLSAEGYGATLEKIERELVALNTKVDTKFADHAKILRQQAGRRTSRR